MSKVLRPKGSKVIKDNDGVAVVEGTPAASLVKDVEKFFAAPLPERMAGESIAQRRTLDPKAINTRSPNQGVSGNQTLVRAFAINTKQPTPKDLEQMNNPPGEEPMAPKEALATSSGLDKEAITDQTAPSVTPQGSFTGTNTITKGLRTPLRKPVAKPTTDPHAIEAVNVLRDFKRQRSSKEASRSQEERDATRGKFITTLGR